MNDRIIGLRREEHRQPLLSTFQSVPKTKVEDEADILAPPQSSDDESEAPPKAAYQSSDSDDGFQKQRDMKPTKFLRGKRDLAGTGDGNSFERLGAPPRAKMSPGGTEGEHLTNEFGFLRQTNPNKSKATFSRKNSQRSSQTSKPKSPPPQESSKRPELKRYSLSESPNVSPKKAAPPKAKLITHSPIKSPSKTLTKVASKSNRKQRPSFKAPETDDSDESDSIPGDKKTQRIRNGNNAAAIEAEKLLKRPAFKFPQLEGLASMVDNLEEAEVLSTQKLGFLDDGLLSEGLKPELSSDEDIFGDSSRQEPSLTAQCPMCGQTVDSELLKRYTTQGRMTIRQQTTFCRSHKRKEAEEIRRCNDYPEIDWDKLEARFTDHKDFIEGILEGERPSHFASLLGNKVETGKDRTLLKTDESLTPGYYGPRGLRLMTELIMHSFSDTVRKRAIEDPLVAARTYTGYVQSVLVPELAVRLIMEDMNVDEEDARKIMQESSGLGDVLHEETKDVVVRESDDED
ncbi:hypothetical protein PG991_002184 [Apiospora marii]|uniref:Restriction of telomere capping protein 4 n=1 Tax=Apiospora marii TaxID=335849 RepID=A0ABR1SEN4_9PEZI